MPYETPVTFTNRHFYDFLEKFKVSYKNKQISWKEEGDALNKIIEILFVQSKKLERELSLIPFGYQINHKQKEFRELAIPHPRSQFIASDFYDRYKETIIHYCSLSSFSIRAPHKIATYKFYNDNLHKKKSSDDISIIEKSDKEYKNQKSFFSYKDYSNIYKFYESPHYHRCEKKYNKLLKLDISKCFDSIYTHSIEWAILGKQVAKKNLQKAKFPFASQFDELMRNINYGETNGIIIGPELSRIFAEVILQAADKKIEQTLEDKKYKLKNKVDYEMLRYVDDYFIFYNEEQDRNAIVEVSQHVLKEYKLYLNSAKEVEYEKPLITEMTIAKERISKLLKDNLVYELEEIEAEEGNDEQSPNKHYKGSIKINEKKLIIAFKTIIKECGVEYKDMLNYSFSIVERKCRRIIKNYHKIDYDYQSEENLIKAIISILEFVFFIYSVSPRVNTTIRLCVILEIFLLFLKNAEYDKQKKRQIPNIHSVENKHRIFKCIYDNIHLVLKKNKYNEFTQVETLYLLIALTELGREYWLEEDMLAEYFGIDKKSNDGTFIKNDNLNYFSLTVILYYMGKKVKYCKLRNVIEEIIIDKFNCEKNIRNKSAEHTLLFFDMLSCPFIENKTKIKILESYGISEPTLQNEILIFQNDKQSKPLQFKHGRNLILRKSLTLNVAKKYIDFALRSNNFTHLRTLCFLKH